MKNKILKIQLIVILLVLFGTIFVSGAKNPDTVMVKCIFKQGPWDAEGVGYNDGRWSLTGALTDGGIVHDDYDMGDDFSMVSSYTLTGRNGDLYIEVVLGPLEWIGPWTGKFEGTWSITGGTGDYATVSGSGDATQIIVFASTMHSGEYMVGAPCISNHVVLTGEMLLS